MSSIRPLYSQNEWTFSIKIDFDGDVKFKTDGFFIGISEYKFDLQKFAKKKYEYFY